MRRAALLAILLSSCGPAAPEGELLPRYAILSTIGPESPMYPSVAWLAKRRNAPVFRFQDPVKDRSALASWLKATHPGYVAVFMRPEEIDANSHLALLEIACGLDDDPFPDFAFGYFPAASPALLRRQMQSLEGIEARVEKRLLNVTYANFGAPAPGSATQRLEWATDLPLRILDGATGDPTFLKKNVTDLEQCDFLLLSGPGGPEGIAGFPAQALDGLKLDALIAFSAADATGAAGAVFETAGGVLRRRTVPPDASFLLGLLRNGAPAVLAPLQESHPALVGSEWTHAILAEAPLGEVLKHTYDQAILASGGRPPSFARLVEGRPPAPSAGQSFFQAATRVLYGDPLLQVFNRKTIGPLRLAYSSGTTGPDGRRQWLQRYEVSAPDCGPFFADPFSGAQRIHLRIPLPPGASRAPVILDPCTLAGNPVRAELAAQALEEWRGLPYVHVLIRGTGLAQEGLEVPIRIPLE